VVGVRNVDCRKILNALGTKVIKKFYEPVLADRQWQKRYKNEIYNFYTEM
jgi:hypothetical protein